MTLSPSGWITSLNADGQITLVETGTATNQSDSGLGTFSMLQQTQTDYDIIGRKAKTSLYASGATQTVSQYDYDDANRPSCSTVRMNPAVFGSLPSSACTLGTAGSDGDDRITSTAYDNANRVTQVSSGLNTAAVRVEQTTTYTDNGKEQTVADGKGNLTTYEYDGFDRLQKVRYPNSAGSGSSTTDFDFYGYDANDNRTSWQRRGSGSAVTFSFDALDRQTSGLRGEIYAYDNLNRRTSATVSSAAVTMSYDALGRMITEAAYSYLMAYQYDLAGNRTRITWPDSVYVTYEYDNLYRMIAAKESGSSTLVGVSYDNLGRRTALSRLNGVTTGYGYDGASRLSSIAHELTGSTYDQTLTMAYTAASQIRTRASSNSLYDWTGTQLTGTYTANGLNQIAAAGSRVPTYDTRGNMTYDGVTSFTYDVANNLVTTTGGGGTTVDYDALGRLRAITQGGGTTSLAYSGPDIVSEFDNSGTLFRRYVPGPNPDEHWVWYNGAGTADRRYYLQDQVGSVIGLADNSGGAYAINAYDEYGIPKSGNQGRYQYTGQAWLSSLGFYSFKARMYHPTLGRFLQTDPTGYDDGLNWYAYVGNDAVNTSDPAGLFGDDKSMCGSDFNIGGCSTIVGGDDDRGGRSERSGGMESLFGAGPPQLDEDADGSFQLAMDDSTSGGRMPPGMGRGFKLSELPKNRSPTVRGTTYIPVQARMTAWLVKGSGGRAPPGQIGGGKWKNNAGSLPSFDRAGKPITYREYDVNKYDPKVNRGPERIVTGTDGKVYYTGDHYKTFMLMNP